jgi:uncharacterized protein (TIGR02246 family)
VNVMAARDEIRDLLAAYALMLDADDIDGCLELFTDDSEFLVFGKTPSGPDKIRRMLTRAPKGMHLAGAAVVDVRGQTATVRSEVLFVDSSTHQLRPALYDDELLLVDGRWRFRRRRCQFLTSEGLSDAPQEMQ